MALSIDVSARPFVITTNASSFQAHTLVLATGADSRWLGVPGEEDLKGGGVSSCATCDGFLYSGKPVVVVGGGDTAMEDALVLARTSPSVALVHRRDTFRASKVLQQARDGRALTHSRTHWLTPSLSLTTSLARSLIHAPPHRPGGPRAPEDHSALEQDRRRVQGERGRRAHQRRRPGSPPPPLPPSRAPAQFGRRVRTPSGPASRSACARATQSTTDASDTREIPAEAAFVAIGHIPNTDLVKGQVTAEMPPRLRAKSRRGGARDRMARRDAISARSRQVEMNDAGYLTTRADSTRTSVDGVFAAGDVADWTYRQAVTSAGSGSQAALDAERWLSENMVGGDEAEEESEECYVEDYETWTMKQLRKEFKERGIDANQECRGCMEKKQFIEVLCRHLSAA